MNEILLALMKLQALEFDPANGRKADTEIAQLRATVPPQILGHYDRLVARGKKGVAVVRNQVCTGCHMRLPIGTINTLMQGKDIQLCDTCGKYLYLPTETETTFVENVEKSKPARKSRKARLDHAPA